MDVRARVLELNDKRIRAIEAEKALVEDTAGRERSEEEKTKFTRLDADIRGYQDQIKEFVDRETRDNEFNQLRASDESLFGEKEVIRRAGTENEQLRAWLNDPVAKQNRVDYEVDIQAARAERMFYRAGGSPEEYRAMNWQTSSGSLIVPTTLSRNLYTYLEASIAGLRIGAEILNTAQGNPILLPKLTAHGVAVGSIPQGTAIAGTDATFGQVSVSAYKYGQLVAVSNELVRDSVFDLSSWLAQDIGYGLGRLVDIDFITGVGTNNPLGMTVLAGAGTNAPVYTGGSLITPTYEKMVDTVYSVNDGYRQLGAAWLMKDSSAGSLRKLRDGAGGTVGAVLWRPSLTQGIQGGQPDLFLDSPVFIDPNCATQGSNAIFATYGWFGEYVIRTVGNVMIENSEHLYFDKDQVAFRGKWTVDGRHRDVSALAQVQMHV